MAYHFILRTSTRTKNLISQIISFDDIKVMLRQLLKRHEGNFYLKQKNGQRGNSWKRVQDAAQVHRIAAFESLAVSQVFYYT